MLTERYSKHAFGIDLANRSATNRIKRYQNVQIVNRAKTIGNYDALVYDRGSVATAHCSVTLFRDRTERDERGIENWIFHKKKKLIRSAWRTRARAHTVSSIQHYFLQVIRRYSFPREFNWHWLKLVK